jgi:hypothetical protein
MAAVGQFEKGPLLGTPIRDLGLEIAGTALEPVVDALREELARVGIRKLIPHFYLSTEWGVPFETIAIGIPFYLAREELTALQAERIGHLEGASRAELLRYLRHEMGHVVNYAYRLYERDDWIAAFGSITQPYLEDYRPEPFSRRFVRHLPGWYAQKHPDEDWSETFAVWMTPDTDWRAEYADAPQALAKLELCERIVADVRDKEPLVTALARDDEVTQVGVSLEEHYGETFDEPVDLPPGLDGALRAIFDDLQTDSDVTVQGADLLIRNLEPELVANVYRWTGHFPERTRPLVRALAARARALDQVFDADREREAAVAVTTFVCALAMNHVFTGRYFS